jgi:tripartite-type tricarboxylate transporter receptor subunit TctC
MRTMTRRRFTVGLGMTLGWMGGTLPGHARAEEKYPSRPIDFICTWDCTWGTGGAADMMARQVSGLVQPLLDVALPVSHMLGASGNTGLAQLLAGKADGYTIATYTQDTLMTLLMGLADYTVDDLVWIARTQVADSFLFVRTHSPFHTIQDLFTYAQANPGTLRVASTGLGTVDDVTVRCLEKKGYKMTAVYPKPHERYAAVLGGDDAEVLYEQAGDVLRYLKAAQLKPLVIFAVKRHPAFPEVPTAQELGLDVTLPYFRGIVAKTGTPAARVRVLGDAIQQAMDTPQWKTFAAAWYCAPDSFMGPEAFGQWVASEVDHLDRLVTECGLTQ